jgi:hypothetical protein
LGIDLHFSDTLLEQHEIYDYTVEDLDKDMATPDRVLAANSKRQKA